MLNSWLVDSEHVTNLILCKAMSYWSSKIRC